MKTKDKITIDNLVKRVRKLEEELVRVKSLLKQNNNKGINNEND